MVIILWLNLYWTQCAIWSHHLPRLTQSAHSLEKVCTQQAAYNLTFSFAGQMNWHDEKWCLVPVQQPALNGALIPWWCLKVGRFHLRIMPWKAMGDLNIRPKSLTRASYLTNGLENWTICKGWVIFFDSLSVWELDFLSNSHNFSFVATRKILQIVERAHFSCH